MFSSVQNASQQSGSRLTLVYSNNYSVSGLASCSVCIEARRDNKTDSSLAIMKVFSNCCSVRQIKQPIDIHEYFSLLPMVSGLLCEAIFVPQCSL